MFRISRRLLVSAASLLAVVFCFAPLAHAQTVTYKPYIQPGNHGPFGPSDQMVIAWQTNESSPNTSAYSADLAKPPLTTAT